MITAEEFEKIADEQIARKLDGEDPRNDCSPWAQRGIDALELFRDTIRDTKRSLWMGHMTGDSAMELLGICKKGIDAVIELDS